MNMEDEIFILLRNERRFKEALGRNALMKWLLTMEVGQVLDPK